MFFVRIQYKMYSGTVIGPAAENRSTIINGGQKMRKTKIAAAVLAAILAFTSAPVAAENLTVISYAASTKLSAPSGIKALTKTTSSITLQWNKVSGASAYRVYIYNKSTGKYKQYKNVAATNCKVTGLSAGTTYKFKVATLKKSSGKYVVQSTSSAVSLKTESSSKLAAPKGITADVKYRSIVLTWEAVKGADAYRVYKYNASTKKYEVYENVIVNQCTVKDLTDNTKYKFKIVALIYKNTTYIEQTPTAALTYTTKKDTSNTSAPASSDTVTSAKEFKLPSAGGNIVTVLNSCNIANYTKTSSGSNTTVYVGDTRLGGQAAEIKITFNSRNTLSNIEISAPITLDKYRSLPDLLNISLGKKYSKTYGSGTANTGYIWTFDSCIVTVQYNSRINCATLTAEYYA